MESIFQHLYKGPVKAVILDWAGTAVDYGSFAPTAVFLRLFENEGVKITAADARSGMGLMKKDHLRTILARPSVAEAWSTAHGAPASAEDIDRLFNAFVPMQLSVLTEYAEPIPGCLDAVQALHERGIKVGSTTGYIRAMMDILAPKARENGYAPDCTVCPDEVPAGRPYPWMCYQNAMQMGVYPMQAMIKVGDTLPDIEEGLNAGMWTLGISLSGNLLGLNAAETQALSSDEKENAQNRIETTLYQAGAHLVIDGIWQLIEAVDEIENRIKHGETPV
jgi:phosphonoacetaldehyde hydrolase